MILRHLLSGALLACPAAHGVTVTFENLSPTIPHTNGGSYEDGANLSGSFSSGPLTLPNAYDSGFWSGWSYSTITDNTTPGFTNQFSAFPGSGSGGSSTYVVGYGYGGPTIPIPAGYMISSVDVANTTYAALSMRDGDMFAKKFGGAGGDDPDFFRLTFTGYAGGGAIGSVTVDLADFTFADNSLDYILDGWLQVDLSPLAAAEELELSFASSDIGTFGINTPLYVAMDNVVLAPVPEPAAGMLAALGALAVLRRRR